MQNLSDIVLQIKEAAQIAARTPNNPEGKLREQVSPIWERFLKEKRVARIETKAAYKVSRSRDDALWFQSAG